MDIDKKIIICGVIVLLLFSLLFFLIKDSFEVTKQIEERCISKGWDGLRIKGVDYECYNITQAQKDAMIEVRE